MTKRGKAYGCKKSIPQTRLRFQRMMVGIPDSASSDEWEDEKYGGEKKKAKKKGAEEEDKDASGAGKRPSSWSKRKH